MVTGFGLKSPINDGNRKWWTLVAACFALFMAILDNLVVNVALPTIARELESSTTQLQWIVSAYILVFASLQITAGGLGDRFGRKRWFLGGIALFTTTSLAAAFAYNAETLIAARAIQGLGAAFILPLSLTLISAAFPPEERGKALGIWSAVSVSGLALGPVIGGFLVDYMSWNWIFLVNVPVGIGAFMVALAVVHESRDTSGTVATDIPGTLIVTGAIATLTWALIEAGERGWGDQLIVTSFAVSVALFGAFVWIEDRVARPMVPLRFFRYRTFTGANVDAFVVSFLIAGVAFFTTLYLQNVHGFSAVRAGLALLPMVAVMMIGSPISGVLINRIGSSKLIALGMAVTGAGTLLFLRAGINASYLDITPAYMVMGLGFSLIFAPMTTAVLNSVESEKSGVASAVNGAVREVGNAFGIALLGTLMNRAYQAQFDSSPEIRALRGDEAMAPLQPVVDLIGSGMGYGGRVVENSLAFPGLDPAITGIVREVSSEAFMGGMDRAILVSALAIIAASIASYVLINDRVPQPVGELDQVGVLVPASGAD
ncbi:MAG TPA: MFS transporter [Thermomicrobiales bacterium]|nr:MFS transporter [Thermomicrobiales bacterium]